MKEGLSQRVIVGHSRPKDGVASLAYDPAIHEALLRRQSYVSPPMPHQRMDARVKPAHDAERVVRTNSIENSGGLT
jgi:hypothetical protein